MRAFVLISLGVVILAFGFNIFLSPTHIAPGGISGLGIIINQLTGIPEGISMLILSVPILIIGYFNLGRMAFLKRIIFVTLTYTLGVDLIDSLWPDISLTDDLLLNALFGGVIGGIGTGLIYLGGSATPGTGILSRILQLRTGIPVAQLYLMVDGGIIIALGLVFGWENALYSMLMLFVWGLATDYVQEGPSVVRTAWIVTGQPEAVGQALLSRLGIGVTAMDGKGMFTGEARSILFCTVSRPDVASLRLLAEEIDPQAFIVIGQGHQASGGRVRPKR